VKRFSQFVFRLGPYIDADAGKPFNFYFVNPGRPGREVVTGSTDEEGIRALLGLYDADDLVVEPTLAEVARSLGVQSARFDDHAAHALGILAMERLPGAPLEQIDIEGVVYQLLRAAALMQVTTPPPVLTFSVEVVGTVAVRGFGTATFEEGHAAELCLFSTVEDQQRAGASDICTTVTHRSIPSLGLRFSSGDPVLIDALTRAFGLRAAPEPYLVTEDGPAKVGNLDLLILATILRAVTKLLQGGEGNAEAWLEVDRLTAGARVGRRPAVHAEDRTVRRLRHHRSEQPTPRNARHEIAMDRFAQFVFRLGTPFAPDSGAVFYFVEPGHWAHAKVAAKTDEEAIRRLLEHYPRDTLVVEPALAQAARAMGVASADFDEPAATALAVLALARLPDAPFEIVDVKGTIYRLLQAVSRLHHVAAPPPLLSLSVEVEGTVAMSCACTLTFEAHHPTEICVFNRVEDQRRAGTRNLRRNLVQGAIEALGLRFSAEDPVLVDALTRAFDLPTAPEPYTITLEGPRKVGDLEILILAAIVQAATELLETGRDEAEAWLEVRHLGAGAKVERTSLP